jgi:hypothetical protein
LISAFTPWGSNIRKKIKMAHGFEKILIILHFHPFFDIPSWRPIAPLPG